MKRRPEYLDYESEAPKVITWLMESRAGAFVFFGGALALGSLIGWAVA